MGANEKEFDVEQQTLEADELSTKVARGIISLNRSASGGRVGDILDDEALEKLHQSVAPHKGRLSRRRGVGTSNEA